MFCCSRQESHQGEIVNAICLEAECIINNNQLACVLCLSDQHSGHQITSLKAVVPALLQVNRQKQEKKQKLSQLVEYVYEQFGGENIQGERTTEDNIVQRVMELLNSLKSQSETNAEELAKMRTIFKNLNKNNQQPIYKNSSISPNKQSVSVVEEESLDRSPKKSRNFINSPSLLSSPSVVTKSNLSAAKQKNQSNVLNQQNNSIDIQNFSQTNKHPYLSISSDLKTAVKVSHSGHRFAALGAKALSQQESEVRIRIDKSVSGNIMVGLCHERLIKEKQFSNCYGIGNGTYLLGQNGNSPTTSISFHHSLTIMNRKEIVGWNFEQGEELVIGINFQENLIFFKRFGKKNNQQFSMALCSSEVTAATQRLIEQGLKLIVLLQSEGDQVSILAN